MFWYKQIYLVSSKFGPMLNIVDKERLAAEAPQKIFETPDFTSIPVL